MYPAATRMEVEGCSKVAASLCTFMAVGTMASGGGTVAESVPHDVRPPLSTVVAALELHSSHGVNNSLSLVCCGIKGRGRKGSSWLTNES